jgi:diguanylate cyclase (GGDEF)-like protein
VRDDIEVVVGAEPGDPDDVRCDAAVRVVLPRVGATLAFMDLLAAVIAATASLWLVAAVALASAVTVGALAGWVGYSSGTASSGWVGADLIAAGVSCVAAVPGLIGIVIAENDAAWSMPVVVALAATGAMMLSLRWFIGTVYAVWLTWLVCLAVTAMTVTDMSAWLVAGVAATGLSVVTWQSRRKLTEELARAQETAALASVRDPLTGLANRRGLSMLGQQMVEVARRQGDAIHCVYVDIDQLAHVNEVAGHEAGDEVVVAVADALRAVTRSTDVVARWGGDEFCVVGPGAGMAPMELERRVRERVQQSPPVADEVWSPKVCAGGAMLAPWDSGSLDALLGKADQEMYLRRALRRGGNRSRPNLADRRRTAGA